MSLEQMFQDLAKKKTHELIMNALALLIEAEVTSALTREATTTGRPLIDLLGDDELMSNLVIDAMVVMIPDGHKYVAMREEAAIEATNQLKIRTNMLNEIISTIGRG